MRGLLPFFRFGTHLAPVVLSHVGIVTHDETIPIFKYILKKLGDYNLAYRHIAGPEEDLAGTAVEALQDDYFSHFRKNYTGRLMANLGLMSERKDMASNLNIFSL